MRRDRAHDVAGTDSVDERLEADEAAAIRECVHRLAIEDQEIVILKAVAGFTFREIATIQGRNQNSVASRYRRALDRIQEELGGR
jgi:RNA polymerase sigma-70 factor (ECF subfamily)